MSQSTYDRLAPIYDVVAAPFEWPMVRKGLELLAARDAERVLEVGHGTGRALEVLAAAGARVVGIDFSPGMARVAGARLARAGITGVELRTADVTTLSLEPGFDAIFSAFTVEIFPADVAARLLASWRKALRGDGRVVLVNMAEGGGGMASLYAWSHRQFPAWVDCRPIDSAALLRSAGFSRVESTTHRLFGLPVAVSIGRT